MELALYLQIAIAIFTILDPLGVIPIYLSRHMVKAKRSDVFS